MCGALLVTSAKESEGEDLRGSDTLELTDLVRQEEHRTLELEARAHALGEELDKLSELHSDDQTLELQEDVHDALPDAGLTAVEGPGLTVSLTDAPVPAIVPDERHPSDYVVHQQDVEAVINALWAGGAEAMTVMGRRVVTTSSIKCSGPVIRVDGKVYTPPYTISAIGDTQEILNALEDSPGVQAYLTFVNELDLGYDVDTFDSQTFPAYDGLTGLSS